MKLKLVYKFDQRYLFILLFFFYFLQGNATYFYWCPSFIDSGLCLLSTGLYYINTGSDSTLTKPSFSKKKKTDRIAPKLGIIFKVQIYKRPPTPPTKLRKKKVFLIYPNPRMAQHSKFIFPQFLFQKEKIMFACFYQQRYNVLFLCIFTSCFHDN